MIATGAVSITYPDGSEVDVTRLRGNPRSGLRKVDLDTDTANVLWVRPTVGAWSLSTGDGSASDDDGVADGHLGARFDLMEPIGDSPPPPERIESHDVVIAINARTFDVLVAGVRP